MPLWKRSFDITVCVAALPALGLFTLVMVVLHKFFSPGPVLFRQERIGLNGSRFQCFKFRTMKVGADCSIHQAYVASLMGSKAPMVKLDSKGDSRLMPFGWLIRASGLDELPQLINVLLGDMSVIGPRPCMLSEFEGYQPWQKLRFTATPGLTGLWQVSGKNRTTFEEMIRLDIAYAERLSPMLDAKIVLKTVPVLFAQIFDTWIARKPVASIRDEIRNLNDTRTANIKPISVSDIS